MKKENSTCGKVNSVFYNCIYCGLEREMTLDFFSTHLNIVHSNIKETDKKELQNDIKYKISRFANEQDKEAILGEYKNEVIVVLENSGVKENKIKEIQSVTGIEKLKKILNSSLKQRFKDKLDEAGIDYSIEPKKEKWKRTKEKKDAKHFDQTINSIKSIYTPMGNRK